MVKIDNIAQNFIIFANYTRFAKPTSFTRHRSYIHTYTLIEVFFIFVISTSSKNGAENFLDLLLLLVKTLLLFFLFFSLLIKSFAIF